MSCMIVNSVTLTAGTKNSALGEKTPLKNECKTALIILQGAVDVPP